MAECTKKGLCLGVCIPLLLIRLSIIIWYILRNPCSNDLKRTQKECFKYAPPAKKPLPLWYWLSSFRSMVRWKCRDYSAPWNAALRVDKNCDKIAEAFTNAVASKDPCYIRAEDYQPLMQLVNQAIPRDKVLFWSKTKDLAHSHRGVLLTLNKMLLGHIADDLEWCGEKNSSEVKYSTDPEEYRICPEYPSHVFWNAAAEWFAKNASGQVWVLLNGSNSESVAYNETSVFRCAEVLNLSSKVTKLHAWVIYDRGVPVRDSCSGSSIKQLKSDLRKDIVFTCKDMDRETFLQCVENPESSQCKSGV